MKKKIVLFFFLIISIFGVAQTFDFEGQYKYARTLSSKNPDSSEIVLNKIIDSAQKRNRPEFLAKAYYLKSFNSYLRSDAEKALTLQIRLLKYRPNTITVSEKRWHTECREHNMQNLGC